MIIRAERTDDVAAIRTVVQSAFASVPYSDKTEHLIVERLRHAGALSVSMVAVIDGSVVGHIGFSPISLSGNDEGWYALAPLSVSPNHQSVGVGSELVKAGLVQLKDVGANGCVVVGDPAYYGRFGFRHFGQISAEGIPAEYFTALALRGSVPSGIVRFHPGFFGDAT